LIRRRRPVDDHAPGWLERWAAWRLQRAVDRLAAKGPAPHGAAAAKRATRRAIAGACAAGFASSGAIAAVEIAVLPLGFTWPVENWTGAATFAAALLGFTGLEFWVLFRLGLRAAAELVLAAALQGEPRPALRHALCRAVIEAPEPELRPFDLDPARYVRRESELMRFVVYRLKVAASNLFAKMVLRRLLTRTGLRGYAPFVAAPITGLWNLWVMRKVLAEVRVRLMGRLAADALVQWATTPAPPSPAFRRALLMLIGNRITLFGEYSLNLEFLLTRLHEHFRLSAEAEGRLDDWPSFLAAYGAVEPIQQARLRRVAALLFAFKRPRLSRLERSRLADLGIAEAEVATIKARFAAFDTAYLETSARCADERPAFRKEYRLDGAFGEGKEMG
jgi:hypothetical protein